MALSKKRSRAITVNGIPLRYSLSWSSSNDDGSHNQNITVQHASGDGCYLNINGVYIWPEPMCSNVEVYEPDYLIITPKHIAKLIDKALEEGWQPTVKAPPYQFKAKNEYYRTDIPSHVLIGKKRSD